MILSNIDRFLNKTKVIVSCEFCISDSCKKEWETSYRVVKKTRLKRGKDCCNKCASKISNSGSSNPSFKHSKNENYFSTIDSELKSYLLGWIASDGSIRDRTLHMELHEKDMEILNLFRIEISPDAPIVKRKNRNTCYITISSKKLIDDICKWLSVLPGNKQNKITLPKFNDDLLVGFVRGFLEGDGCICITKYKNSRLVNIRCSIASIDTNLKQQFKEYASRLGIKGYISSKSIEWNGSGARNFLDHLYDDSEYKLTRKHEVFIKYKELRESYEEDKRIIRERKITGK